MKDQNGKPENGNGERVLKIAEVCRPDSKREQNPFPGKQVLCAGAEDARVRLDGVNPNLSAIISVIDASGKEIDRAEIAEGETKSVAGRVITLVGVSLLAGAACEYNYTYDYGDQDAVTNPPLVCPTIPVTDRCEGGDNPNQLSCTAYVGSAVDFDGYLFRVAEVREESGVTKVYVDVLEQSLDCRLLHTLELTVGVENGFSVGTDNYTILPRWAEIGADPDAPAVVGLDITKTYTEPAGPICAEETDRCFYRNDNGVRCTAYENRAVEFDGYLFVAYSISDGIVEIDVQDKELGCERIASLSVEAGGDERLYSPSFLGGGATYAIRARGATIGTGTVPPTVDLEVRRVSDEPAPTVCPETTDRCEEGLLGSVICSIYQDMAAEVNGVLFAVRNVREEGGVTKFDLEVSDRELGCGVSQTLILGNRDNANVTIGTQSFNLFVGNIVLDGTASWVYLAINPNADICSTVHVSERCEGTASSVRCMVYNGDALEMDGVLFFVNSVSTDPATASVSIYDRAAGCTGAAGE